MADVNRKTQLLVIGGGPGGYPAALAAAAHGLEVTLVDADPKLGGVCLNRGCIPSKALLHIAKVMHEAKELESLGVEFSAPKLDLEKVRQFVQTRVVGKLTTGIAGLCKNRGVTVVQGRAVFISSSTVQIEGGEGGTIEFEKCILSTGSIPAIPKPWVIDDPRIMDSTAALLLPEIPKTLLVIGGGYIGLELGTVYATMGSKVTVVEGMSDILALADRDLVGPLEKSLRKMFEAIYTNTKVQGLKAEKAGIVVELEGTEAPKSMTFDRVLIAVGRRANTQGLGLENTKVKLNDRNFVQVDLQRRTDDPNILAIGDITGDPGLAHKATAEARVAVETILGEPAEFAPRAIPAVIYTDPEMAWCGLTERDIAEQKLEGQVEIHRFPWSASGRATALARVDGLTKLIVDKESQRVLGVGIVGAGAGELIAEGVLAVEMGAVARDMAESIHPHPTLSETLMESAESVLGSATHLPIKKPART